MSFSRMTAVAVAAAMFVPAMPMPHVLAQPCNPIVDGTYCAEHMAKSSRPAGSSSLGLTPIRPSGTDFIYIPEQPATLGSITFRGNGERCVGLLFRGGCK